MTKAEKRDVFFIVILFLVVLLIGLSGVTCDENWNCKEELGAWGPMDDQKIQRN